MTGGQLTASAMRRDDSKLIRKGLRKALNARLLNTGGAENRFGRSVISLDAGRTETIRISGNRKLRLQFYDGAIDVRDGATNDMIVTASDMPWTIDTVGEIMFGVVGRTIVLTYRNEKPITIAQTAEAAAMIDRGAGTVLFYGPNFARRTANGFDDDTTQASGGNSTGNSTQGVFLGGNGGSYLRYGKDFGANPQKIGSIKIYGSTDHGYWLYNSGGSSTGDSVTIDVCASNTAPVFTQSGTTTGRTVIATVTFDNLANESAARTLTPTDTTTEWRYVWIESTSSRGAFANDAFCVAELQFFTPTGAERWTINDFEFADLPAGGLAQPFYRFAGAGITMTPGSTAIATGVTVTFSNNVLSADHVGCYFRYVQKQLKCTAVASATSGTFDILEDLPPTIPTTVASTKGFAAGMVVVGASSGAEGIVSSITSGTVMHVVMLSRFAGFVANESIASSSGAITTITSVASATTPEAVAIWDEGAVSDFRGWPASVSSDRDRLIFCDVPAVPDAVLESKIGIANNFEVGGDASDAIFEIVPGNARVVHVVGGADQFVLTEDAAFYIPISAQSPLAPGFVDFKLIAAFGCSQAIPVKLKEGVIFGAANGKAVCGILPSNFQSGSPWQVKDVSEYHSDLFSSPVAFAVAAGGDAAAEQYLYTLNSDGTAVVGRYDQANQFIGFVPLTSAQTIKWISAFSDTVYFNCLIGTTWTLETIDSATYLDGSVPLNTTTPALRPDPEDETKGRLWFWAGQTVDLMLDRAYLGSRVVDSDGNLTTLTGDDFSDDGIIAGFKFSAEVSPFLPDIGEGDPKGQRMRRRRVKWASLTVQDSTEFSWMNRTHAKNPVTGDPDLVSGTFRGRAMGRSFDPEISFTKTVPGPFRIIEIDGEVTA